MTKRNTLENRTFSRLSRLYLIALSTIALSIVISQMLIQRHLQGQLSDSRVVNIAGRQRMLSQKLAKQALMIKQQSSAIMDEQIKAFDQTIQLWQVSHDWLQAGNLQNGLPGNNSPEVQQMFRETQPFFDQMIDGAKTILANSRLPNTNELELAAAFDQVLLSESKFLAKMDALVFQYDAEAQAKVRQLRRTELILLAVALLLILLELLLVFRPTAINIRNTIKDLIAAEKQASEMRDQVEILYNEKEKSLQELKTLTMAVDQATLFASCSTLGNVSYMSKKLQNLLGLSAQQVKGHLAELITEDEAEQTYLKQLIKSTRFAAWNEVIKISRPQNETLWLELSIMPVKQGESANNLLIVCNDISSRLIAQAEIDRLKEEQFKQTIEQQKSQSVQIIDAQEEERKRIARDMHDGIGQMLTALKFNLQAVDLAKPDRAKQRLKDLNTLAEDLIRGVRIATFNLTPPELVDYGIAPALSKLANELQKLTKRDIRFVNKTRFDKRLSSVEETNLYRITQEAVNNAIKYAQSNYILISISHSSNLLSILVDDDGIGYDTQHNTPKGNGMGTEFMRERIKFINGRLFVHSVIGEGTRVTINMPLPKKASLSGISKIINR